MDLQLTDDAMKKKLVSTLTQTRNEGRVDLLLGQLTRRSGAEATKHVEHRVRTTTTAEVDRFADQVLDAKTIDDVFTTAGRV